MCTVPCSDADTDGCSFHGCSFLSPFLRLNSDPGKWSIDINCLRTGPQWKLYFGCPRLVLWCRKLKSWGVGKGSRKHSMSRDFGISPVKYLSSGKERLGSMQVASTSKTSNRNLFLSSFLWLSSRRWTERNAPFAALQQACFAVLRAGTASWSWCERNHYRLSRNWFTHIWKPSLAGKLKPEDDTMIESVQDLLW